MDTQLVEKIVHEVKSQGVFDEFRKDSMADVDTKPAYQNLRQRVENTVKKFLAEQKWTPETNKNQLREKLRKHITESGFLDVGVERIVDQVVNPKIGSVFQPRIEEIAYKYLGLPPPPKKFEPPPPPLMHPLPPLPLNAPPLKVETSSLLPTDLEQVSPDSDKGTVKSEGKDDRTTVDMDTEEKLMEDEDESPPFEPLVKQEDSEENKQSIKEEIKAETPVIKQECDTSSDDKAPKFEESNEAVIKTENMTTDNESQETCNFAPEAGEMDKEASQSVDARISQDSQLSSVSSDSRLSVNGKEDSLQSSSQEAVAVNISEEAQMPKFSENSCEPTVTNSGANDKLSAKSELHFDIKKDEIKFEGTERKTGLEIPEPVAVKSEEEAYMPAEEAASLDSKTEAFKFNTNKINLESKEEGGERMPTAQELSFGSSIEDSSSVPPSQTSKIPAENKEKDESLQPQTPKQTVRPSTPTTTPILTPPIPTPQATPSPITSQKTDKEHQSRHSSSSSSKHKKHSKERRRSYEREKDKDSRDRHRSSKDSRDSSKYHSSSGTKSSSKHSSSSSSKYSSSHNKSTEKDIEKSSSSSTHSSSKHTKHSHSHSSSSSNENQDSKKSKRDSDNRRHHSSSSSSSKRSERKDDHGEAKHKTQRRKSTDSNDDEGDKSLSGGKSSSQYKSSSYSSSSGGSKSSKPKYSNGESNKGNDHPKDQMLTEEIKEESNDKTQYHNNVVILNDILENPQTQFIQLNQSGHLVETPVPPPPPPLPSPPPPPPEPSSIPTEDEFPKQAPAEFNNNIEPFPSKEEPQKPIESETSPMDLLYFEEVHQNLTERLKHINDTMDLCRNAVNSLRFDSLSDEGIELSNEEDINSDNNKTNLLTETLKRKSEYNYEQFETTPRKRIVSNDSVGSQSKTSPTPSDTSSVNSKENEEIHKNTDYAKKSLVDRHKAVQKLTQQQRYSSEDLYKPRPILGQRSRRRGMDSLV